jgi:outer membrane protein OmpA-like peptidoglycan-associated protein
MFHLGLNSHSANFQKLPDVPNCCPGFESGTGTGLNIAGLVEFPLSDKLMLSARVGYSALNATLSTQEPLPVIINGQVTNIFSEHSVAASLSNIGIEPLLGYRLFGDFSLHAGGRMGFTMQKKYDQKEMILPQYGGTFGDGRRVNNDLSGDIPNASSIAASVLLGASYELPLNSGRTFLLAPEIFYSLALTPIVSDWEWKANSIRFGIALKYSPKPAEKVIPPPIKEVEPERKVEEKQKTYAISAQVSAVSVNEDNSETAVPNFVVEEFISTQMTPLLNYLFFEENSAELPSRYKLLPSAETTNFQAEKLFNASTIEVYYNVLNIVGQRMRDNAASTISLVGSNADVGTEKGNTTLSKSRADAVKDYLVKSWGIAESRIKIETPRNLPEKPSNPDKPEGAAENRRVEIRASAPEITEPVIIADTILTATPLFRFRPKAVAEAGLASWTLTASHNGKVLKQYSGRNTIPSVLEWKSDENRQNFPRTSEPIRFALDVRDAIGQAAGATGDIPVELITVQKKRDQQLADKIIDRYNLILFDFDKAELSGANTKLVDFIKRKISQDATVKITGFSDNVGDDDYNLRLSDARAKSAAKALNIRNATAKGVGESQPLFNNDLPEGRFYNRTVEILVTTPVRK